MWSAMRWQTFNLMAAYVGSTSLAESGIYKPTDLLQFPWEKEPTQPMSDDEIKEMQEEMKMFQDMMRNEEKATQ